MRFLLIPTAMPRSPPPFRRRVPFPAQTRTAFHSALKALPCGMPSRPSKPRRGEDINEAAFRVVREATADLDPDREKNPAAVALGKLGASKGGKARAAKLSAAKRKAIARKAARERWKRPPE
jgi:hypothetical protein